MKRMIKPSRRSITASTQYTNSYTYSPVGKIKFRVYTKNEDDPENFQCMVTEIHPYDDAEYFWIRKDAPNSLSVIQNGKVVDSLFISGWDEETYTSAADYVDDVINYMCEELRGYNKDIKPVMVYN